MRYFTFFLVLLLSIGAGAQELTPTLVTPTPHSAALPGTAIAIRFEQPLEPSMVNDTTFRVFGRWSGPAAGELALSADSQTIAFTPAAPFFAGELVTVRLSRYLQGLAGETLPHGYAWEFGIRTAPGSLVQLPVDTIFLREPGEGLLQAYGAYAGDLNHDGFSDLTVINETADDLRILLNDGTGHYPDMAVHPMGNSNPSPNEGADFNRDGHIDLAVTTAHDNELRVMFGDGQGNFTPPVFYPTGAGARGVAVPDCNGDGWDDIFITNRLASNINVLINDSATFEQALTFTTVTTGESAVAAADANLDGITDMIVGAFTSGNVLLLLGQGDCTYVVSDIANVPGEPWMVAAGDWNGDGFVDAASANSSGDVLSVLFGDGQGELSPAVNYTHPMMDFPLAIDAGDLDGDGDLDLVTSNYMSSTFTVFQNNGSGVFSFAAVLHSPGNASCATLHDRDNDGDLDISGTDETDDVVTLWANPGVSGTSSPVATSTLEVFPNPVTDRFHFMWNGRPSAHATLFLTDLLGRRYDLGVRALQPGRLEQVQLDARPDLSPGIYFLEIRPESQPAATSRILLKP
jgi:hypothetical protein